MDLSAPGVGILTAVPPALDTDGVQDGYQAMDGTSFSAPMVSAAMAWVRAARPGAHARPRHPGRRGSTRARRRSGRAGTR